MNNKYFVSSSINLYASLQYFLDGNGPPWTVLNKPLSIVEILSNVKSYLENIYTLKYMEHYGIENVRGGDYMTENLSDYQKTNILKQINPQRKRFMRLKIIPENTLCTYCNIFFDEDKEHQCYISLYYDIV